MSVGSPGTSAPPPPSTTAFPAVRQLGFVATPSLARPGYRASVLDPTWGTRLVRVSDQAAFGSSQPELRHQYAKSQAWNSDGTRLLLDFKYPGRLLDGNTYADLGSITQPAEASWANTNPNIIYGVRGGGSNEFVKFDLRTKAFTTIRAFTQYPGQIFIGPYEGNLSRDDRYVVITGERGSNHWLTVYDIIANTIIAEHDLGTNDPDWASISPSGRYVVVNWGGGTGSRGQSGVEVYSRTMQFERRITTRGLHADMGYDHLGNEVYVQSAANLPMWRLDTGALTYLLPANNSVYAYSHVSMRSFDRPGWAYVSHYNPPTEKPGSDQVIAVKTDGSGTVQVFAHAHHASTVYATMPMAVPSRDGSRVLFASEWVGSGGPVYAYVAGMNP